MAEKFENFSDEKIEELIDGVTPKNTKKATAWGVSVFKGKLIIFVLFSVTKKLCFLACLFMTAQQFANVYIFLYFFRLATQKISNRNTRKSFSTSFIRATQEILPRIEENTD